MSNGFASMRDDERERVMQRRLRQQTKGLWYLAAVDRQEAKHRSQKQDSQKAKENSK